MGAHDLSNKSEVGRVTKKVKFIVIHQKWNPHESNYNGDIAIVKLDSKIKYTKYIVPVCLMGERHKKQNVDHGKLYGWGVSDDFDSSEPIAKVVDLEISSISECVFGEKGDRRLSHIAWTDSFCAGQKGKGICKGDSGSGLFVKIEDRYYLRGIVSSAIIVKCSETDKALFSDVQKYENFIMNSIDVSEKTIYVPSYCINDPDEIFSCDAIVKHMECDRIGSLCCRSCLLDGQLIYNQTTEKIDINWKRKEESTKRGKEDLSSILIFTP